MWGMQCGFLPLQMIYKIGKLFNVFYQIMITAKTNIIETKTLSFIMSYHQNFFKSRWFLNIFQPFFEVANKHLQNAIKIALLVFISCRRITFSINWILGSILFPFPLPLF